MATLTIKFTDKELAVIAAGIAKELETFIASPDDTAKSASKEKASKKAKNDDDDFGGDEDLDGLGDDNGPEAPTIEDVRKALKEYASIEGKPAAIQILKDNGASSIGELKEKKFASVIAACDD